MTDSTIKKHDLEDHIELLHQLDKVRKKSWKLMEEGIEILQDHGTDLTDNEVVEISLVIRALSTKINEPNQGECRETINALGENLKKLTLQDLASRELSVLIAARVLQALVVMGEAFSSLAIVCYYWIIRELYSVEANDWCIGSARAQPGGLVTAFVTSECVDALLSFAQALENTREFLSTLDKFTKRKYQLKSLNKNSSINLKTWLAAENEQLKLSCFLSLKSLSANLVLRIPDDFNTQWSVETFGKFLDKFLKSNLKETIEMGVKNFEAAKVEVENYRDLVETQSLLQKSTAALEAQSLLQKSTAAHEFALFAVNDALKQMEDIKDIKDITTELPKLQDALQTATDKIRKLLRPSRKYLAGVLDHELAIVSLGNQWDWQPTELVFAATDYGRLKYLPGEWTKDMRFNCVATQLSRTISRGGRIPNNRPFHIYRGTADAGKDQYHHQRYFSNFLVLATLARFLYNLPELEIELDFVEKMLSFFEESRATKPYNKTKKIGWSRDLLDAFPRETELKATAHAVYALAAISQMLDVHINHIILGHFSVKDKDNGLNDKLSLDTLFYPDYGLKNAPNGKSSNTDEWVKNHWPQNGIRRTESVAITLQRMRAHVSELNLPKDNYESLWSLVLHGPAGTGKTTLIEALATSCNVPLVEVTPSDLVKKGEENIEARARAVFYALSLLNHAVILFDEFDPVLKRRNKKNSETEQLNVFSFLTPGMLPKLKDLHECAEKRSVAYVLITNRIGNLDEAAVRPGRFDERIGIYPPDLLSRVGRLLDQLYSNPQFKPDDERFKRIAEIIKQTAGKGMTTLGKPGWFTAPKDNDPDSKTPFNYVLKNCKKIVTLEADDELKGVIGKGVTAEKEFLEWQWVTKRDEKLNTSSLTALKDALDDFDIKLTEPQTDKDR